MLKANGYAIYGFKAGTLGYSYILRHDSPTFFGVNQFSHHHDFPQKKDEDVVDRVLEWRENRLRSKKKQMSSVEEGRREEVEEDAEGQYYFTVVFLSRAHAVAYSTKDPARYWAATQTYDNNFMRLIDAFRPEIEDGSTALILSSDHAEMLGENTYYGHGWNSIEQFWRPELLRIPLSLCLPNTQNRHVFSPDTEEEGMHFSRLAHPTSSVDLLPTLFDYFQMDPPLPASIYSHGKSFLPSSDTPTMIFTGPTTTTPTSDSTCDPLRQEQVVAFDNLSPIDRVAMIRKTTLSSAVYNLNDCRLFSWEYHTGKCQHSQMIVSLFNLSSSTPIPNEQTSRSYDDRLECMRRQVFRYLSHPIPQLLHAQQIRHQDESGCVAFLDNPQRIASLPCDPLQVSQLWVPSQRGQTPKLVSVARPTCHVTLPNAEAQAYQLECM